MVNFKQRLQDVHDHLNAAMVTLKELDDDIKAVAALGDAVSQGRDLYTALSAYKDALAAKLEAL